MKIGYKLIFGLFAIVSLFSLVSFLSINKYHKSVMRHAVKDRVEMARTIAIDIARIFHNRLQELETDVGLLGLSRDIALSDDGLSALPDIQAFINKVDADWVAGKDTKFISDLLSGPTSQKLRKWLDLNRKNHGHSIFLEAMLLNRYGAIIGATGRTTDYFQADEEWYRLAVKHKKLWMGDIQHDESAGVFGANVVAPVYDDSGAIVGHLKVLALTDELFEHMESLVSVSHLMEKDLLLTTHDGRIIFASEELYKKDDHVNKWKEVEKHIKLDSGSFELSGDKGEGNELIAYAVANPLGAEGNKMLVFIEEEISAVEKDIKDLKSKLTLILTFTFVIVIIVGIYMAYSIAKPIAELGSAMSEVSSGKLDTRVDVHSKDEVGLLAQSFNMMTAALQKLTVSRDSLQAEINKSKILEEKLRLSATTDKLTGAYNRTKFDEIMNSELSRAKRYDNLLSLIIIDIDWFKSINDKHGHLVGDEVLKDFSGFILRHKRDSDYFFRWGGEEFVLLTTDTGCEDALSVAERLRIDIQGNTFGTLRDITVSMGVTEYKKGENVDVMLNRADSALYRAKNEGRNRVCSA